MSDQPTPGVQLHIAGQAIAYMLTRMRYDPRLAYLAGPGSQLFELMTGAAATIHGFDVAEYRKKVEVGLKYQRVPSIGNGNGNGNGNGDIDMADSRRLTIDPELLERVGLYNDHAHDMGSSEGLSFLFNHFLRLGIEVAEKERDSRTEELF